VANASSRAASAVQLDETGTRELIDQQLRTAGWEVDSQELRHSTGARPVKGKNRAIAEWPTGRGPADYVLFVEMSPLAVVEAKRKNVDVSGAIQQAKRYSRDIVASQFDRPGVPWGENRIPFAFSANGRPLRPYQKEAIRNIEDGISKGRRSMLLAMVDKRGQAVPRFLRPCFRQRGH
jgi:type I restriction enzyme R subunit